MDPSTLSSDPEDSVALADAPAGLAAAPAGECVGFAEEPEWAAPWSCWLAVYLRGRAHTPHSGAIGLPARPPAEGGRTGACGRLDQRSTRIRMRPSRKIGRASCRERV